MNDQQIPPPGDKNGLFRGLFASKTLWIAILVTFFGAASWGYAYVAAERPAVGPASSLSASEPGAAGSAPAAPRAFRYGVAFAGAFVVAYFMKKLLRSVLLVAGLVLGMAVALRYLGVLHGEWGGVSDQLEQGVREGMGAVRTESERMGKVVMGFLPSGFAAGLGALFGARRG
ncbi:MAG: hypothetical protein U0573_11720 [Phycisphaerales bacterium]|nr:hypothetical protein [Planctomycetota bacterium]